MQRNDNQEEGGPERLKDKSPKNEANVIKMSRKGRTEAHKGLVMLNSTR